MTMDFFPTKTSQFRAVKKLGAVLTALCEEHVASRQRHGDVFIMCGSYPTAPRILTIALFGHATISAVTCESDLEAVQSDLILRYQDSREKQLRSYSSRLKLEGKQRRREEEQHNPEEQMNKKPRQEGLLSFEEHAIAQRQYANPHLDHCPLRKRLYVTCECYRQAARVQDNNSTAQREAVAEPPVRPFSRRFFSQNYAASQDSDAQLTVPYKSMVERGAALWRLRMGLNLSGPRSTPHNITETSVYDWTYEHYPDADTLRQRYQASLYRTEQRDGASNQQTTAAPFSMPTFAPGAADQISDMGATIAANVTHNVAPALPIIHITSPSVASNMASPQPTHAPNPSTPCLMAPTLPNQATNPVVPFTIAPTLPKRAANPPAPLTMAPTQPTHSTNPPLSFIMAPTQPTHVTNPPLPFTVACTNTSAAAT